MFVFMLLRMLRRRNLPPRQRRRRFFCTLAAYLTFFLTLGILFLVIDSVNQDTVFQYPMIICFVYSGIELFLLLICLRRVNVLQQREQDQAPLMGDQPFPAPNPNYANNPQYGNPGQNFPQPPAGAPNPYTQAHFQPNPYQNNRIDPVVIRPN